MLSIAEWTDRATVLFSLMKLTSSASFSPSIRISLRLKIHQAQAKNFCRVLDIRVPQIVKPDARQTGAAADEPELAGNIVRAERCAVLTDADIIALVVGFAVFPAVFLLAAAKIGQIPPQ